MSSTLFGQDLRNTEWTTIDIKGKDGSKIVDPSGPGPAAIGYLFEKSSVTILLKSFAYNQKFSIKNKVLTVGDFQRFSVDTVDNTMLILTEIPRQKVNDDKINRFTFTNRNLHLGYLLEHGQIVMISDTLVHCNDQFSPTYSKGRLDEPFWSQFKPFTFNTILIGSFILTPDGNVSDLQIMPDETMSKTNREKFIETFKQTSGSWILPRAAKSLHFKIDFVCQFMSKNSLSSIMFIFHTQDPKRFSMTGLTLQQIAEADTRFNKGLQLLLKDEHEKAIIEFDRCIATDSLYIDAYYNKSYSYLKLGDKKSACDAWGQLKAMGQKQGEQLYLQNCN